MKIANVRRLDTGNLGDMVCSPLDYFQFDADTCQVDVMGDWGQADIYILGGGGLFHFDTDPMANAVLKSGKQIVLWGIGTNDHSIQDREAITYPKWTDRVQINLRGIRDNVFQNTRYIPCPSCMHSAFRGYYGDPSFEFVIYEHAHVPMDLPFSGPKMQNWEHKDRFTSVIQFLSRGRTVITNTWHGTYWSLLLGRNVIIYKPFSSRFLTFKPHVKIAKDKKQLETCLEESFGINNNRDYLAECRMLNQLFRETVRNTLNV